MSYWTIPAKERSGHESAETVVQHRCSRARAGLLRYLHWHVASAAETFLKHVKQEANFKNRKNYWDHLAEVCALVGNHLHPTCSIGKAGWWSKSRAAGACWSHSLAGLVDVLVDVLRRRQLGDTRLGLLVGHLSGCGREVFIALETTGSVRDALNTEVKFICTAQFRNEAAQSAPHHENTIQEPTMKQAVDITFN